MSLRDEILRHKIILQRYAAGQNRILTRAVNEIVALIDDEYKNLFINLPRLKSQINEVIARAKQELVEENINFVDYESEFILTRLQKNLEDIKEPDESLELAAILLALGLGKNRVSVERAIELHLKHSAERLMNEAERVKGTEESLVETLLLTAKGYVAVRSLALATAIINTASTEIHKHYFKGNVSKVIWTAILDKGTCSYCKGQDGRIYNIYEAPPCPAHANCRCELIPI